MKYIPFLALISSVILSGCGPQINTKDVAMPKELSDCSVSQLNNVTYVPIVVVRCPLSTTNTSYQNGKSIVRSVTVDENEPPLEVVINNQTYIIKKQK